MLTMSTVSNQKFAIPRISLFIFAAGVVASSLSLVPASYPATVPAHAKNADLLAHNTQTKVVSHHSIAQIH